MFMGDLILLKIKPVFGTRYPEKFAYNKFASIREVSLELASRTGIYQTLSWPF